MVDLYLNKKKCEPCTGKTEKFTKIKIEEFLKHVDTWSINNKELILEFDSIQYPGSRYKGDFVLLLDGRKLLIPIISREQFERLVDTVKASNLDGKIKIKTYERFVRKFSKAPKNFRGKMRKQYFKRTEDLDCETEEK